MANLRKITALPKSQPIQPLKPEKGQFYNVPNSTASNLVLEVLGSGTDVSDLPARKRKINHNNVIEVFEDNQKRQIKLSNPKAEVTIELSDIDNFVGNNKTAKKMFVLALIKANEQAIHNGQLTRDTISFPLQELIDIGFYKAVQSARKGFKDGMDTLLDIKISGKIQQTKKKETLIEGGRVLFKGWDIINGQCFIYLNELVNWKFIAQYFTILPRYYFKLPNRASDLLYYIFYIARQHTRDIEERGYFTISFRAIQQRLQLPSEIGNREPQKTIKQPIEDALDHIETEHSALYKNMEFSLLPVYDDSAPIADFLNNGYLKIEIKGAFAETFIERSKETAKQIEITRKRQDRIIEKAVSANLAKKFENEDRNGAE